MAEKISIQKRLILETTLKIMFEGFYEDGSIVSVSSYAQIDQEKIRQYYSTDENLRMSAIKYAAVVWVELVKADLKKQETQKSKLYVLIRHFISGSESHPQSLSLYLDIWKKIRNLNTEARKPLSDELSKVYQIYVRFFQEAMNDIYENKSHYNMQQLAWIMVIISDGFHIQSFIQSQQLDFDEITHTFCKMLKS